MADSFDLSFYRGKRVFVTGHTGFKGSWLCRMLVNAGAEVTGYSLNPPTTPSLFEIAVIEKISIPSLVISGIIRSFSQQLRKQNRKLFCTLQRSPLYGTAIRILLIPMRRM